METKIKFTQIDINKWARGQHFWYFSKMAPTGYSLTVEIDVTKLKGVLKKAEIPFYPAYLWLVTKVLNEQAEFKIAEIEGNIGYFEYLTPLYAVFHNDDKTFSLMWTEYKADFNSFYADYCENISKYGQNHGILSQTGMLPPENAYTVSTVPWVNFKHFAVHTYENKPYYFPSVESGKFFEKEGRVYMPLSITCHHATTDGYHINLFIDTFQNYADNFEKFL